MKTNKKAFLAKHLLITALLFCIVSFTGCDEKKIYADPPLENIKWGMTKEECIKALGLEEAKVLPLSELWTYGDFYYGFSTESTYSEKTILIDFLFSNKGAFFADDVGLSQISIVFYDIDDGDTLYQKWCEGTGHNVKASTGSLEGNDFFAVEASETTFSNLEDIKLQKKAYSYFKQMNNVTVDECLHEPLSDSRFFSLGENEYEISYSGAFAALYEFLK